MVQAPMWAENRVEDILTRYRAGNLPGQQYTPDQVILGTRTVDALDPNADDFNIFVAEMTVIALRQRNPMIADIIARNSPRVWDAVRMVNSTTKQGYGGAGARGARLLVNPFETRDFGRAGGFPGTAPPTDWLVNYTAIGGTRLWPPSSGTIDLTISSLPVMSHVIMGFMDPVLTPKVANVQLVLDSDPWPEEVTDFEWREGFGDNETPIYELKNPWVIRPGASYRVSVRLYITGEDKLIPIGFSVKRALDIIASVAT